LIVSPNPAISPAVPAATRLASIDAYRGFVMFQLMAEVLQFVEVSRTLPDSEFWKFLACH
jgi:heparan-alpha-glucosaminide N-acetyltransferase